VEAAESNRSHGGEAHIRLTETLSPEAKHFHGGEANRRPRGEARIRLTETLSMGPRAEANRGRGIGALKG